MFLPEGGLKWPEELLRCRVSAPLFHREAEFVKVGERCRRCTLLFSGIWTWVLICLVTKRYFLSQMRIQMALLSHNDCVDQIFGKSCPLFGKWKLKYVVSEWKCKTSSRPRIARRRQVWHSSPKRRFGYHRKDCECSTEMRFNLGTWLGEIPSCSCLKLFRLALPAGVLLNKICKDLISSLYSIFQD